jgi:hypothetical protein
MRKETNVLSTLSRREVKESNGVSNVYITWQRHDFFGRNEFDPEKKNKKTKRKIPGKEQWRRGKEKFKRFMHDEGKAETLHRLLIPSRTGIPRTTISP